MAKVLVIDDDRALTQALEIRLTAGGFDVCVAHDAIEGARQAVRERPDVILIDADIPRFSGLELHECLKFSERCRGISVVYLSANDSDSARAAAFRNGAMAFIGKPFDAAHLIQTLHSAMARKNDSAAPATTLPWARSA